MFIRGYLRAGEDSVLGDGRQPPWAAIHANELRV